MGFSLPALFSLITKENIGAAIRFLCYCNHLLLNDVNRIKRPAVQHDRTNLYLKGVLHWIRQRIGYALVLLADTSKEKLIELAVQQKDSSYYLTDKQTYESLKEGQKVRITTTNEQMDSLPPIRIAKNIEIL
ncbi:DUF3221 domain-containing protein [Paenibacillus sp. JX-17]|uniref:DUF3221 domain-containing protein n=1 Tax=Paenibacillus lacisoli TaxID=3064525 RepID=A0ABT9CJD4_9BACL|nr:DUF3221 domain-containing protein [Paenibacillus sp. JX-17]MDO7908648.1 DUF3221 domain-containing protein [Paenibacillus sp. JX-17]